MPALPLLLAHLSAVGGVSISVNTTKINAGDAVRVSWTGIDLDGIAPMHVVWASNRASADGEHRHEWRVEPENAESLWVGQFSPPIADASDIRMGTDPESRGIRTEGTPPFTEPAPVKFISGSQLSNGEFTFIVSNMRADVNWVLFSGSLTDADNFAVLAISPALQLADAAEPMHVRLARTSSAEQLRVSWTSAQDAFAADHVVQWGGSPTRLDRLARAVTHTYAASDLCGFPANESGFHAPGHFHEAVLDLSAPAAAAPARYYYRVGSDAFGWSATHSFGAPAAASAHGSLSVLIAADMGETYEDGSQYHWEEPSSVNTTIHMARLLQARGADLIFHPGDIAYATGYASEWDRFMAQIEPLAARAPYMVGMGNHERDFPDSGSTIGHGDSGGECGVPTQARFHMPTCPQPNTAPCVGAKADPSAARPHSAVALGHGADVRRRRPVSSADDGWYSFEQGPVHFLMLHTEVSSAAGSRQFRFVDADLAAVNRGRTPWVVVLGHRQMYNGNVMTPQNELGDLEPLLLYHKVDFVFAGHIHNAQLSCPMVNATCVTAKDAAGYDAPIYAIIGNAGQTLNSFPPKRHHKASWSVYEASEWGFSHLTAHNATHLTLDFYADAPLDATAPLHHSVTIERKFPRV